MLLSSEQLEPFVREVEVSAGAQPAGLGTGDATRRRLIALEYLVQGLRMGLPAAMMVPMKKSDFPRYKYARIRWVELGELTEPEDDA